MRVLFFIDVSPTRWGGYYWAARRWLQIEERVREFFATDTRLTKADKSAIKRVLPTQRDSKNPACLLLCATPLQNIRPPTRGCWNRKWGGILALPKRPLRGAPGHGKGQTLHQGYVWVGLVSHPTTCPRGQHVLDEPCCRCQEKAGPKNGG